MYPDDDYRLEYKGEFKDRCIPFKLEFRGIFARAPSHPHGSGTLILKDGKSFSGQWTDDVISEHDAELKTLKKEWDNKYLTARKQK